MFEASITRRRSTFCLTSLCWVNADESIVSSDHSLIQNICSDASLTIGKELVPQGKFIQPLFHPSRVQSPCPESVVTMMISVDREHVITLSAGAGLFTSFI